MEPAAQVRAAGSTHENGASCLSAAPSPHSAPGAPARQAPGCGKLLPLSFNKDARQTDFEPAGPIESLPWLHRMARFLRHSRRAANTVPGKAVAGRLACSHSCITNITTTRGST